MNYYVGVDLGTSSVKSLLMDADGRIVCTAQVGYDIQKPTLLSAEQDMEVLWDAAKETLRELVTRCPAEMAAVQGISYSGQMHGLVMVDRDGKPIRNAIIWADQRSGEEIEEVYRTVGEDAYRRTSLNSLSTGFLLASLLWVREHEPEHFERIRYVMFPKDYIRYRMCGEIGTEMSDASSGAIFDTAKREWAWELMDALGLPREIFPKSHESCEIAGTVTEACAAATGLRPGIRIAYGGGDTLMMGLGNGIIDPGVLAANIGTSCQLSCAAATPLYDPQYRTNTFCHVRDGRWLLMGANLSGGVALKWLKNSMLGMDSYDEMTALAATALPGSEGMVCLPYLSGERTPYNDPLAKGIYYGMTLRHGKAHMIRSTMEGIVYGLRASLEIFKSLGISYHKVVASGGGARGRLFLEMQADILDCEICTNTGSEQAGIGAAITAAVAAGEYRSYEEACARIVRLSDQVVTPNRENQKRYAESYAIYRELYGHNRELFHMETGKVNDGVR